MAYQVLKTLLAYHSRLINCPMTGNLIFSTSLTRSSQFTGEADNLSRFAIPPDYYVAGRLDKDSEDCCYYQLWGTTAQISHPRFKMRKHYWVQIEGEKVGSSLVQFRQGIALKDGKTRPRKQSRFNQCSRANPPIASANLFQINGLKSLSAKGKPSGQKNDCSAGSPYPTTDWSEDWRMDNRWTYSRHGGPFR